VGGVRDLEEPDTMAMNVSFVEDLAAADHSAIIVTLFRATEREAAICGWYLGPIELRGARLATPYLPRSRCAPAAVAVLYACQLAAARSLKVCIVDPQSLWKDIHLL
jgi:hypothetical protein